MSAINKFTPGEWRVLEDYRIDGIKHVWCGGDKDGYEIKLWHRRIGTSSNVCLAEINLDLPTGIMGLQEAEKVEEFHANVALFANSKRLYYALEALVDHIDNPSEGMIEEAKAALKAARGEA